MRLLRLVALVVCAITVSSALAADWPYWRGPNRDGIAPDTGINKDWNQRPPEMLWQLPMHDGGFAGPSAAGGRVFIIDHQGDQDIVRAIDLSSGEVLWQTSYQDLAKADYGYSRSTPVYDEGRLYTISYLGKVHCINAEDGQIIWSLDMQQDLSGRRPRWGYAMSARIDGEKLILVPGAESGCVAAVNKNTGETIWQGGSDDIPGYSTPVKATIQGIDQYVVFTGKSLTGVRAEDGQLLWRVPWETEWDVNAATPIVSGDNVFITSNYGRGCAVIAVEADGARILGESKGIAAHFNTPAYYQDYLFGPSNPNLVCLDPRNLQVMWQQPGFERGGVVAVDGVIIAMAGKTGHIAMVEATPEGYNELGRIQPLGGQSWSPPIIADGKLIIRNTEALACLDLM
ncbi:MAG: PQQ-binding-like beta-propeller repeat protein [Armatimonadota bacterium]